MGHSGDPDPLLALLGPRIDLLEAVRIFQGGNGVQKIQAMLATVLGFFGLIPFVVHVSQTTGYR
jgi:hypothetical protein